MPALWREKGGLLTEYPVISYWIAQHFPQAGLLPDDAEAQIRALEWVEYIVGSLHMRGSVFVMRPGKFSSDPQAQKDLIAHGRGVVKEGYERLATALAGRDYFFDRPSIADAAALYLARWNERLELTLPPALDKLRQRLEADPATQRAIN